jgi:hypothetical protein
MQSAYIPVTATTGVQKPEMTPGQRRENSGTWYQASKRAFPHLPLPQPGSEIHYIRGRDALVIEQGSAPFLFGHRRHILDPRQRFRPFQGFGVAS